MLEFLKDRVQREFKQIVKKHGPWVGTTRLIHDLPYREPESHKEHDSISLTERSDLINCFYRLQDTLHENMIYGDCEYPFHLIGVLGDIYFKTSIAKDGEEKIEVSRKIRRNTGVIETEYFALSNKGNAEYAYSSGHPEDERQTRYGSIRPDGSTHNKDLAIDTITSITSEICDALDNPAYQPDQIRERVIEVRKGLLSFFEKKGIIPKQEKKLLGKTFPKAPSKVAAHTGEIATETVEDQPNAEISVGFTYEGLRLPNLPGTWSVQYDIDDPDFLARAYKSVHKERSARIKTHGTVLILTNELYDKNRALSYSNRYVFCGNGDLEVSIGNRYAFLDSFSEEGHEETGMHDPHFALVMAQRLERQIVRKPTEIELTALKHDLAKALK